jgi:hypothetical protein
VAPKKCQQVNRSPINFFMHYITLFHLRLFETSLRFLQISSLNCKLLPRSTRSLIACLPSSLHIHYCIHHLKKMLKKVQEPIQVSNLPYLVTSIASTLHTVSSSIFIARVTRPLHRTCAQRTSRHVRVVAMDRCASAPSIVQPTYRRTRSKITR